MENQRSITIRTLKKGVTTSYRLIPIGGPNHRVAGNCSFSTGPTSRDRRRFRLLFFPKTLKIEFKRRVTTSGCRFFGVLVIATCGYCCSCRCSASVWKKRTRPSSYVQLMIWQTYVHDIRTRCFFPPRRIIPGCGCCRTLKETSPVILVRL